MFKKKEIKPINPSDNAISQTICIGSFSTSMHIVFPLIKVLNKIGSVNLITEDKSFLMLTEELDIDYYLGNVRVRLVDCISVMPKDDMELNNYNFNILDIKEYIPTIPFDKYIFLTNRNYYRQQLLDSDSRNKQIYSVLPFAYITVKQKELEKKNTYVHEELVNLKSYNSYDKYLFNLIEKRDIRFRASSEVIEFISTVLENYNRLSRTNIRAFLEEGEFQ